MDRCCLYGDDVAIAVRTEAEAIALAKALPEELASHPSGPFLLKRCEVVDIRKGFDFLKYRHVLRPGDADVWCRPAAKSFWRYEQNVAEIATGYPQREAVRKIAQYRRHWIRAFPRWTCNALAKNLLTMTTHNALIEGWRRRSGGRQSPSQLCQPAPDLSGGGM